MKLCLDEHYSVVIARELRARGHDADAVTERPELVSLSDRELWNRMQDEHRAIVTENVADFMPLIHETAVTREAHWGVVFSSPRSLPRGTATIGVFVERLDELMRHHADEDAFRARIHWLQP